MTGSLAVQYSLVEFRKNSARAADSRLLLGLVFAISSEEISALGWRWRAGIPAAELEELDPLARELFEHRKSTLKSEVDEAMQSASVPTDVLARLAARNPWSFHVATPLTAHVEAFDRSMMSLEDWVENWTARVFEGQLAAVQPEEDQPRKGRTRKQPIEVPPKQVAATWLEMPRVIHRVLREPIPA